VVLVAMIIMVASIQNNIRYSIENCKKHNIKALTIGLRRDRLRE